MVNLWVRWRDGGFQEMMGNLVIILKQEADTSLRIMFLGHFLMKNLHEL